MNMENFFSFNRFAKYFAYDLRNARNAYGMTLLVLGLLPVIMFLFFKVVSWIFLIGGRDVDLTGVARAMAVCIAYIVVMLGSPAAIFGKVTDRRYGSSYLLVPASTFEKWLSMMLILCILVPVVLCALLFACDTLLCWFFPNSYGQPVYRLISVNPFNVPIVEDFDIMSINVAYPFIVSWISSVLFMALGALVFKRAKVAKTFFVSTMLGIITSVLLINTDLISMMADAGAQTVGYVNTLINVYSWGLIVILAVAIYFRLRTIKL